VKHKVLKSNAVAALVTPGRYNDGAGLTLVVRNATSRQWVLRTMINGRRTDIGLGSVATVSLARARELAESMRSVARNGEDPLAQRRAVSKEIPTFAEAAHTVHASYSQGWKNPKHSDQWINTLTQYVFQQIGKLPINVITTADVLSVLTPIWLAKPETARRVRGRIETIFRWARAQGVFPGDNPAAEIAAVLPKQQAAVKHHAALPFDDVSGFVRTLRESDAGVAAKLAFEFTILTAARTSEVLGAQWSEIDFTGKTWTVPAERMKAKREHRVPLASGALVLLKHAKKLADGDFVFPGRSTGRALSTMVFLMALRRMKLDSITTAHGFRSSFRDWAAEKTNFPERVVEAALAHTITNKVEAAYNRTDLFDRRRQLMEAWDAFIAQSSATVIPIRAEKRRRG
jgi:integrase